ncbi:MAG: DUF1648 domain-containing protein [Chloroflexi bacterium]|nr:DUF1648 domain-containing protein [Chloroflexota bacterium]
MRPSRILLILCILLALWQAVHYAPLLPERVASHFDAAGRADGWSPKGDFFALNLAFAVGMALLFLGLSAWLAKIPIEWISLPHKDYWLAPERRAATLQTLQQQMEWLAAATVALLVGITQLTIEANLAGGQAWPQDTFWLLFGGYMAFFVVWLVWLLRKWYARPAQGADTP